MKLGVTLPLSDIGGDPATVRLFAQAAEAAGYVDAPPDHVFGVNVAGRAKLRGYAEQEDRVPPSLGWRRDELARRIQGLEERGRHSRYGQ